MENEGSNRQKDFSADRFRVVYLFAGARGKGSLAYYLRQEAKLRKQGVTVMEQDMLRSVKSRNFLKESGRRRMLSLLRAGKFDWLVACPPGSSFSRARWANNQGPRPLRSATHPRGFKNLWGSRARQLRKENALMDFTLDCLHAQVKAGNGFLMKHPEDLGKRREGGTPGSIWRWEQMKDLAQHPRVKWGAFLESDFGTPYPKPTRLIGTLVDLERIAHVGPPAFDTEGLYEGPLPRRQNRNSETLIGREGRGFKTATPAAAWPDRLCKTLATLMWDDFLSTSTAPVKDLAEGSGGVDDSCRQGRRQITAEEIGKLKKGEIVDGIYVGRTPGGQR